MQMHGCAAVWEQAAAAEQQQQEIARSAATVRVLGRALREELAAEEAGGEEPVPPWYTRWWAAVALATAAIATFITWAIDTASRLLPARPGRRVRDQLCHTQDASNSLYGLQRPEHLADSRQQRMLRRTLRGLQQRVPCYLQRRMCGLAASVARRVC